MNNNRVYFRIGTLGIDEFLKHVVVLNKRSWKVSLFGYTFCFWVDRQGNVKKNFFGKPIKINTLRYRTFKEKGVKCATCGVEGKYFAIEKHACEDPNSQTGYHANLYALDAQGNEVLMTIDHIKPRSKRGQNTLKNTQPMCCHCNNSKGDNWDED